MEGLRSNKLDAKWSKEFVGHEKSAFCTENEIYFCNGLFTFENLNKNLHEVILKNLPLRI